MNTYKLIISYDGTAYCGWQIQPNGISIQEILEEKVYTILRKHVRIIGSGRTDTGVHALGQVAHFKTENQIDCHRFFHSINSLLPHDIRVLSIEAVPEKFHAQHGAKGKIYCYYLNLNRTVSPFRRLYSLHVYDQINLDMMKQASQYFLGTHDFTSFTNQAHTGCAAHDAVRTIRRLDLIEDGDGYIRLEFEGDGFLYKMVRNIVGTLLDVAREKTSLEDIPRILAAKDRRKAGQAAPPQGLFLVKVHY